MSIELKVPEVGESISEVEIGEWLKKEGDFVERDDDVVIIETDKATLEVPAPESGTITKILKPSGQTASVHEVIAYLEPGKMPTTRPIAELTEPKAREPANEPSKPAPISSGAAETWDDDRKIAPLASRSSEIPSTERPVGRLKKSDKAEAQASEVMQAEAEAGAETLPEQEPLPQKSPTPGEPPRPSPQRKTNVRESVSVGRATAGEQTEPGLGAARKEPGRNESLDSRSEEITAMSLLRRRIAERLVDAQQHAALLTTFNEVDMLSVIELRGRYREAFRERYQTKLGFMSFFVKATIDALRRIPEVNAEIRENSIAYRNYYDIGIAVGGGKGLVVPVLRNAERLSFAEIERAIADFARRAEQNQLAPAELQGGTFTISNGGIYGSLLSTPIVNPPQSGILGLHAIQQRAVVRDGTVVIRPMMYIALTYDHRLIDGREAVTFLKHVKDLIEDPARQLLGI